MTYRVVQWSTGNVGRHAIAGIDARPDLELVGVWVSNPDKAGKDAGQLAGLGRDLGVTATNDADALLALKPDCVVHTAMADTRLMEAIEDLKTILRAGVNVVSSSPVFLQFPDGVVPADVSDPIRQAAEQGGASLWVNGIDPGFAKRLAAARRHRYLRAHRRGAVPRDPQLQHVRPGHCAVRHHGLWSSAR